jgi:vacuolar-type H+-ATPase subunit D/Vma8
MFIIDITLKSTPVTLSIQRKTEEDAEAVYKQVAEAIASGNGKVIELTCEQQKGKKISVLSNEISAVQVAEKSSTATASGRPPGFAALVE